MVRCSGFGSARYGSIALLGPLDLGSQTDDVRRQHANGGGDKHSAENATYIGCVSDGDVRQDREDDQSDERDRGHPLPEHRHAPAGIRGLGVLVGHPSVADDMEQDLRLSAHLR